MLSDIGETAHEGSVDAVVDLEVDEGLIPPGDAGEVTVERINDRLF